ncbi:MAG TPA: hypothetical protein VGF70_10320 [Solirubrobacteraceae bacterium]|jgi:hypothetical protein
MLARPLLIEPELRPGAVAPEGPAELADGLPLATGAEVVPLLGPADDAAVPDDPAPERPAPEVAATELPEAEPVVWLTTVEAVDVAPEAVETAECVAEVAVETTDPAVEVAVDAADCTVDDAVLVALETTGGVGTDTEGTPEAEAALADGVVEGSPEARLADAPDPTMAAGARIRAQTRISGFARFMGVDLLTLKALTRGGARTFPARTRTFPAVCWRVIPGLGLGSQRACCP